MVKILLGPGLLALTQIASKFICYKHLMTLPLIAAEAYSFFLIKKKQKIKTEKSFSAAGQTPWPAFLSCLCPLLFLVRTGLSSSFMHLFCRSLSADRKKKIFQTKSGIDHYQ